MGAGGGVVRSSQRDARSSSLQRMVRRRWLHRLEVLLGARLRTAPILGSSVFVFDLIGAARWTESVPQEI